MCLLNTKAKEQEMFIQDIKLNMQSLTKSYADKSHELDGKKKLITKMTNKQKELKEKL